MRIGTFLFPKKHCSQFCNLFKICPYLSTLHWEAPKSRIYPLDGKLSSCVCLFVRPSVLPSA